MLPLTMTTFCIAGDDFSEVVVAAVISVVLVVIMVRLPGQPLYFRNRATDVSRDCGHLRGFRYSSATCFCD
jgi:hypothetical protein